MWKDLEEVGRDERVDMPKYMKSSANKILKMYALSLAGEIPKEHSSESLPWLFLIILMQVHNEKGTREAEGNEKFPVERGKC